MEFLELALDLETDCERLEFLEKSSASRLLTLVESPELRRLLREAF